MVDRILKVILLFTPIAYCVGVGWHKFELVFFQLSSILLFMAVMFDTPKREFNIKKLLVLFLGICLFSVTINSFQNTSLSALINIFLACLDVYIITVYSRDLKKCFNWLLIGLGINTLIFIGQVFNYSPVINPDTITGSAGQAIKGEYGGVIGNAPRFAAFIALTLPFVKRYYLVPAMILGFFLKEVSIFFSVVIIITHELGNKEMFNLLKVLYILALLAVLYFHKSILQSFTVRFGIWQDIINNLAGRPLIGFGVGNFKLADYGMSSMLQWVYGVGIGGIGFIAICLKRIRWYVLPLVFLCLFEYPFEIPRLYPVLVCVLAYWAIEQKEDLLC